MKIVEKKASEAIVCPFCDSPLGPSLKHKISRICSHTLMVTDDEKIWFQREDLSIASLQEDNFCTFPKNKKVESQVVMIKTYGPAPSFFGAYYLFKA